MTLTGLQKEALRLYRSVLRVSNTKPQELRTGVIAYVRDEFERLKNISPKDINLIEHHIRKGRKQLELLKSDDFRGIHLHQPK